MIAHPGLDHLWSSNLAQHECYSDIAEISIEGWIFRSFFVFFLSLGRFRGIWAHFWSFLIKNLAGIIGGKILRDYITATSAVLVNQILSNQKRGRI